MVLTKKMREEINRNGLREELYRFKMAAFALHYRAEYDGTADAISADTLGSITEMTTQVMSALDEIDRKMAKEGE